MISKLTSCSRSIFMQIPLFAIVAVLAACATRPDGSVVTIADDVEALFISREGLNDTELRQLDRIQRYAKMRVTGAAGGAVGGALIGLFVVDNAALGAAGGAVAGAAVGYLAGAYVANLNSAAEDRRDDLNVQLAAAKKAVSETQASVKDNRAIVAAETRKIRKLNQAYRAGKITKDQYASEIETLDRKVTIVNESLRAAEDDVKALERTAKRRTDNGDASGAAKLTAQKKSLEREVARLQRERLKLIEAVASIPSEVSGATS